ncbi:F-box protein At2g23160 [Brachypodium distachyon]|uniref:F-box domain-containing protein n=1 Tax=Brachypodium distachyon TaxID=15368 RepID=A0A0Q3FZB1_BRADI|nr:F-box protein At2g23160 [Brachypodium distachyon]KQK04704.1 hypothetical protein BRADI_2g15400v3 [Brachypodium distachyon]PNT70661.1 hypothetical protein BRADI_2g15400v3 [Brachypodium distachyon]|eukprot:XP_003565853.2 F-box protein At2g23160 [Brachypodium distachyon]
MAAMERAQRCSAASLTEDLIVEILSRVPVKPLCRFKCVSKAWENLISHPEHRKKLPQTLAGFLYTSLSGLLPALAFTNASPQEERYPIFPSNFSFLPEFQDIRIMDCCNGLLLCRLWESTDDFHYVLCNPATEKFTTVPPSGNADNLYAARLGFDPAVSSSRFHVFELVEYEEDDPVITGVRVYSSETREWVHKEVEWSDDALLESRLSRTVFLNGSLHILTDQPAVLTVDTELKTWRKIHLSLLQDQDGFIQQSQGRLHYVNFREFDSVTRLAVYILEDYGGDDWVLKHSVEASRIFGTTDLQLVDWVAMHPECNLLFFSVGWDGTLMSYDMDRQQVRVIRNLGHDSLPPYLPCVPFYSELPALENET